jgi:hypothetical protein
MLFCLPCNTYFDIIHVKQSRGIKRLAKPDDLTDAILTQLKMILGTIFTHRITAQFGEG